MKAISRPSTLKEQALEELRNSIMLGKLKPGVRLVERVLGEQLQVSRTVIRECIRHLESERLVTIIPNSGPIVTELNEAQIREIYHLRAVLESDGVRECAKNLSAEQGEKLLNIVSRIEKHLERRQVMKALELTTELYSSIFSIGGRAITWDLIAQLNSRINQLRIRSLSSSERSSAGPKSLRKMVESMINNTPSQAAKACKDHVLAAMAAGVEESKKLGADAGNP